MIFLIYALDGVIGWWNAGSVKVFVIRVSCDGAYLVVLVGMLFDSSPVDGPEML